MQVRSILVLSIAICGLGRASAGDCCAEPQKSAGLDQFKQLAGEWVGTAHMSGQTHEARVIYKTTSGDNAVLETIAPGTPHEMITVIHQDGDALALTHYCHLGNQPHMKAASAGDGKQVAFKFAGASNMKSELDNHMHDVTYTFVDADTLKSEWTHYKDGKPTMTVVLDLKRKK